MGHDSLKETFLYQMWKKEAPITKTGASNLISREDYDISNWADYSFRLRIRKERHFKAYHQHTHMKRR